MKAWKALTLSVLSCGFAAAPAAAAGPGLEIAGERTAPFIAKICSPFVPGSWRSITIVPPSWTIADCQAFARRVGATSIQLGCMFDEPQPTSAGQRFSWAGRNIGVDSTPAAGTLPAANCGWRM